MPTWTKVAIGGALLLLVVIVGCSVCVFAVAEELDSLAAPIELETIPERRNVDLVAEFGCQWILDVYGPIAGTIDHETAVMHLATEMSMRGGVAFVGIGDAAAALRECGP